MKLPNGDRAVVDIEKLRGYCLNPRHPRGRNKARVFASAGIAEADAEELRMALLRAQKKAMHSSAAGMLMGSATSSISN